MASNIAIDHAGSPPRFGRVLLAALVLAAIAPVGAHASTVEVRGGVLTVAQAPGEATTVTMLPVPGAAGAWQVSAPRFPFGAAPRFDAGHQGWPGTAPAPGMGCAPTGTTTATVSGRAPILRCDAVTKVALTFGDGADFAAVASGTASMAGGGGRDFLTACAVDHAVLDGGPGDDNLLIFNGSAAGGPGDDYISVASCALPGAPIQGRAVVDCGPGNDVVSYSPDFQGRINARTCPPIIRALRPVGLGTGSLDRVGIPANYRLRVPLFRSSEAVHGTVRLIRYPHPNAVRRGRPYSCSSSAPFRGRSGQAIAVSVTISRSVVRHVIKDLGKRFVACFVQFSGKDGDGERFSTTSAAGGMRGYQFDPNRHSR